ncbi:MAG: family 78 glycoside hydrolase catalytic domain [Bacillota bacterium]|nr:family 78 glycoside hydrolase catalytic domain [Bacillota bacterium]
MIKEADWITPSATYEDHAAVVYFKDFKAKGKITEAKLYTTCLGVYEAKLNGERISNYYLAPGWTAYHSRLQYQEYDVTKMLKGTNKLEIEVGDGWIRGRVAMKVPKFLKTPSAVLASLYIKYDDGTEENIITDETWNTKRSNISFNELYDGETCDANFKDTKPEKAKLLKWSKSILIPQEGEFITEHERLKPILITAPNGEKILDFGQNMTGYVEIELDAKVGDRVILDCGEVLDADGNFYRDNYRSALAKIDYTCCDGHNVYKPRLTFYGFRYLRVLKYPGKIDPSSFTGICVYSDIKKTGHLECSNKLLNRLFDNIFWGQKDNYLDIPTDCPQRDERNGWAGDAQVFTRTASYNYDVYKFFDKWLQDMAAEQHKDGEVFQFAPRGTMTYKDIMSLPYQNSAAWGDAATICPWEIYMTYGNIEILKKNYKMMSGWVDYITGATKDKYLWTGHFHYGDWLGVDAPEGSYEGKSNKELIATAYYAYSTSLVIKAGKLLKKDVSKYEELYKNIVKAFRKTFPSYQTQTEHAIALHFDLAKDKKSTADSLAKMVKENGNKLTTGFVGTPCLLHALSENGYADVAYSLLLQEEYPSWLFSVRMGATTIWEHWDGKKEDGSFWSEKMNSFNHYAYGAVADWVYGVAAGINRVEEAPGFKEIVIKPVPDKRLSWLEASIDTRCGVVSSKWVYEGDKVRYEITTPSPATIVIEGKTYKVGKGTYIF